MNLLAIDVRRNGRADQRPGYVVQERRHHKNEGQERQSTGPIVRQNVWRSFRQIALLEMAREHGEAQQQQAKICEFDPVIFNVGAKANRMDARPATATASVR